jgi:hypothetical protein
MRIKDAADKRLKVEDSLDRELKGQLTVLVSTEVEYEKCDGVLVWGWM